MYYPAALQCFVQQAGFVGAPAVHHSSESLKALALADSSGALHCLVGFVPTVRLVTMRFQGACTHPCVRRSWGWCAREEPRGGQ